MVKEYECPNCGASMVFDSALQQMVCGHCGTARSVQEMEGEAAAPAEEAGALEQEDAVYHTGAQASFKRYSCPGCGAEILTDEYTAATFCSFCGNPALLEDRLSEEQTPARIIPFKINREKAQEMYRGWCRKGLLTPSDFTSRTTIEKITGMYVPFWLYDYTADARLRADCTKVRRERRGNMEYTHTDYYHIRREVGNTYEGIPMDASKKMPDDVMDKLEPYSYGEMQEFNMGYLSGYMAEKYNYTSGELKQRVEKRVENYIIKEARDTITGYSTTAITERRVTMRCREATYAMLPVWLLNYRYKGKDYLFTLNGQTGKIVGRLPTSTGKLAAWFAGVTAGMFVILTIMGGLLA